jgi:sec-independent protein translocase protein TatC
MTSDNPAPDSPSGDMPFLAHLVELRDRLLRVLLSVVIFLLVLLPFANELYEILAKPLLSHLPDNTSMIATQVASPFLTPFKLTLVASVFLSMPVVIYQFWSFVAPGLYKHEKRLVFPLMLTSTVLFYLGMAFAYYVVFPLVFAFFVAVAPEGVAVMTDISSYLDFVLKIFFAFGVAFEVPVATIILVWAGVTTAEDLARKRPYVIVGAFVIGMLLTPPDMISQTLLALPMWILFELGLFFSKMYAPEGGEESAEGELSPQPSGEVDAAETLKAELHRVDRDDAIKGGRGGGPDSSQP